MLRHAILFASSELRPLHHGALFDPTWNRSTTSSGGCSSHLDGRSHAPRRNCAWMRGQSAVTSATPSSRARPFSGCSLNSWVNGSRCLTQSCLRRCVTDLVISSRTNRGSWMRYARCRRIRGGNSSRPRCCWLTRGKPGPPTMSRRNLVPPQSIERRVKSPRWGPRLCTPTGDIIQALELPSPARQLPRERPALRNRQLGGDEFEIGIQCDSRGDGFHWWFLHCLPRLVSRVGQWLSDEQPVNNFRP